MRRDGAGGAIGRPRGHTADVHTRFRLYRPRPDHPDWGRLDEQARELAGDLLPRLASGGRSDGRRRRRAYLTFARNYLRNLGLVRAGREDLRPLYFIWTVNRECNFDCAYCDDHRGRKYPDLPRDGALSTEDAVRVLRVMRTGTPSVYFAGGEPTLRPDLAALSAAAAGLDYYPIIVNTNGSVIDRRLASDGWRSWLSHTDIVVVSLDALGTSTLADLWGYRRPEEVLRNLLLLRRLSRPLGFELMVNTVIGPGRIDDARDVLDFANDLGIGFAPVPENVGPGVHPGLLDSAGYRDLADVIVARKRAGHRISGSARLNRRLLSAAPLQCRNTLKPHIDFDGRLFWPCKASVNVAPERIDVLDHDSVDELYAAASRRVDPTRFHGPARNQCGADCCWAQNYTTDEYVFGMRHPLHLASEVLGFSTGR